MHTVSLGKHTLGVLLLAAVAACSSDRITDSRPLTPNVPSYASSGGPSSFVVNVSRDTTAQNETPVAVNPLNAANLITGNNDWNWNNGCGVNASFDGGRTWTPTLPKGFIPGITRYTNDPSVPGTGAYDFGGDPAVAFAPDGTAYFACFGYQATPPYGVALLLSRSTDGGVTWLSGGPGHELTLVSAFQGNGKARGSTGQFPDHDAIHVASDGTIYLTWAQFTGNSSHSPVYVATSVDGGRSFGLPVAVTSGSVRSDQDQRVVTDAQGTAYLTFDNSVQGGKGTAMYVSKSTDQGKSWSSPILLGTFQNPVCLYPPYCFNISGGQFRGPGSYPVPAIDPTHKPARLYVAYTDIIRSRAQVLLTYASVNDLTHWSTPQIVAPGAGDRINVEMSIEPKSGRIDMMANDRSWSGNTLFDVTYFESLDGGQSWTVQRVTKSSWDPSQYGVPAGETVRPFIGDYDGIVSLPTSASMTWTGPGKTYGALPTNLEVYFGKVTP